MDKNILKQWILESLNSRLDEKKGVRSEAQKAARAAAQERTTPQKERDDAATLAGMKFDAATKNNDDDLSDEEKETAVPVKDLPKRIATAKRIKQKRSQMRARGQESGQSFGRRDAGSGKLGLRPKPPQGPQEPPSRFESGVSHSDADDPDKVKRTAARSAEAAAASSKSAAEFTKKHLARMERNRGENIDTALVRGGSGGKPMPKLNLPKSKSQIEREGGDTSNVNPSSRTKTINALTRVDHGPEATRPHGTSKADPGYDVTAKKPAAERTAGGHLVFTKKFGKVGDRVTDHDIIKQVVSSNKPAGQRVPPSQRPTKTERESEKNMITSKGVLKNPKQVETGRSRTMDHNVHTSRETPQEVALRNKPKGSKMSNDQMMGLWKKIKAQGAERRAVEGQAKKQAGVSKKPKKAKR